MAAGPQPFTARRARALPRNPRLRIGPAFPGLNESEDARAHQMAVACLGVRRDLRGLRGIEPPLLYATDGTRGILGLFFHKDVQGTNNGQPCRLSANGRNLLARDTNTTAAGIVATDISTGGPFYF